MMMMMMIIIIIIIIVISHWHVFNMIELYPVSSVDA